MVRTRINNECAQGIVWGDENILKIDLWRWSHILTKLLKTSLNTYPLCKVASVRLIVKIEKEGQDI